MASDSPSSTPPKPSPSLPPPSDSPPPSSTPPSEKTSPPPPSKNSSPSPPPQISSPPPPSPPPADPPPNSTSPPADPPKKSPPSSSNPPLSTPSKASKTPPPPAPKSSNDSSPPPPENPSGSPPSEKQNSPPPLSSVPPHGSNTTPAPTVSPPESAPSKPTQKPSPPSQIGTSPGPPAAEQSPSLSPPQTSKAPSGTGSTESSAGNAPKSSHSKSDEGLDIGIIVGLGVVFAFILIGILGTAAFFLRRRKKKDPGHKGGYVVPATGSSHEPDITLVKKPMSLFGIGSGSKKGVSFSPHDPNNLGKAKLFFSYEKLREATNGFASQNLLGEGGFGSVYKGKLPDGKDVAIKTLKSDGEQGEREFRAEVEIITRIHHRHLVSLVGYCIHENSRLLVYEYVPNNNLYCHLHSEGAPVLHWDARVKIAVGAARGIAYLHEDCDPRIIHRDIKSSNILLDNNFEARVSDFGLAKLAMDVYTHVTTRVMGTFGYLAPEYASTGKLTEKSDVYSFGVVLLELITGRKPLDPSQSQEDGGLVEWARPLLSKALETNDCGAVADPRLEGHYVPREMFKMIEVAAACIRHSHKKRPKTGQVARALDIMVSSDLTIGMKVGESNMFSSTQQAADFELLQKMAFENQDLSSEFFKQGSTSSEGNRQSSSQSESSSPGLSKRT